MKNEKISFSLRHSKTFRAYCNRLKGTHRPDWVKYKISKTMIGRKYSKERIEKSRLSNIGKTLVFKHPILRGRHISLAKKGVKCSKSAIRKNRLAAIRRWQTDEYIQKQIRANCKRPNYKEKYLNSILQKNFPNEWKYVGNGDFILGRKNPDFMNVNGKKLLIELFGRHWHTIDEVPSRVSHFKQFGFNTLIIWSDELNDSSAVIDKINDFMMTYEVNVEAC